MVISREDAVMESSDLSTSEDAFMTNYSMFDENTRVRNEETADFGRTLNGSLAFKHAPITIRTTTESDEVRPKRTSHPHKIASLNARSILKESNKNIRRLYLSYLRLSSLHIDILCLKEVSAFHTQSHLDEDHSLIVTRYVAIICLSKNLILKDKEVSLDQRAVASYTTNLSGDRVPSIVNIYAPAETMTRKLYYQKFMDIPFLHYITSEVPGFLLDGFHTNIQYLLLPTIPI
ncbi:hypothetical protein BDF21DRAFT_395363 [Thamnidium elegans]|nr:hypothetical protein BDF21DRAFT_395363 [Thamnidium elegans]